MALHVVATITARSGAETVVGDALRGVVVASRAEDGCLEFELYQSCSEAAVFVVVEQWRDQDALEAHQQADHVVSMMASVGEHVAGEPVAHLPRNIVA